MTSDDKEAAARLVRLVGDGDREAEAEIYRRYERGLRFLLRKLLGDANLAEDLAQEAFIILLTRLRRQGLDDPGRLNSFLYGIARKLAAREIGRRATRELAVETSVLESSVDPMPDQFDEVSREQLARIVHELFDELHADRDRQILRRFWIYDEDKETICDALEIDDAHFHRVNYRAKQRFRGLVDKAERRKGLHVIDGAISARKK